MGQIVWAGRDGPSLHAIVQFYVLQATSGGDQLFAGSLALLVIRPRPFADTPSAETVLGLLLVCPSQNLLGAVDFASLSLYGSQLRQGAAKYWPYCQSTGQIQQEEHKQLLCLLHVLGALSR